MKNKKAKKSALKSKKRKKLVKKPIKRSAKKPVKKAKKPKKIDPFSRTGAAAATARRVGKEQKLSKKEQLAMDSLDELITRGRGRGFVTDNEVMQAFPKLEDDLNLLENVYKKLEETNIKVVETSQLIELPKESEISKEEFIFCSIFFPSFHISFLSFVFKNFLGRSFIYFLFLFTFKILMKYKSF